MGKGNLHTENELTETQSTKPCNERTTYMTLHQKIKDHSVIFKLKANLSPPTHFLHKEIGQCELSL